METVANTSARGQISQSHAVGAMTNTVQREWGIACFLIAAGNLSFFSYADWGSNAWTMAGTQWWPEYQHTLGAPLDPPLKQEEEFVYVRRFSSGTTVRVDVHTYCRGRDARAAPC